MSALPPNAIPASSGGRARGVVYLHSIPRALAPHVEWALNAMLETQTRMSWESQPVAPATLRAEYAWAAKPGTASRIASSLRTLPEVWFEVTEESSPMREGERYAFTPLLGLHRAIVGVHGDVLVSEDRLRAAIAGASAHDASLIDGIQYLLGLDWDTELEPYRSATADTPVRVIHQVV